MEFKERILDNGLRLIAEVNPAAKSAAVGFFVRTGARDETPEINGVSHFLEHMLFKGTEDLDALAVNAAFDNQGAQFNAFTSEENTVYYAAVLPECLEPVTALWSQLITPALRDEDFNIEKNVIKEEIAMYQDMPSFDVMDRCRSLHFGPHNCGHSVLGSVEGIDALTATQMRAYFSRRYTPANMVVAWAGDVDFEAMCSVVENNLKTASLEQPDRSLSHTAGTAAHESLTHDHLVRSHVCLMSEGVAAQDPRRFTATLLASIVGDDTGSRYYWDLVDRAVAEAASMQFGPMDGTGAFYHYFRCTPSRVSEVIEIVDRILARLGSDGITPEELLQAQNKILSALVIKNELPMGRLLDLGFNWTYLQTYRRVSQDVAAVKAVTVDQVNDLIRAVHLGRYTRFVIGP